MTDQNKSPMDDFDLEALVNSLKENKVFEDDDVTVGQFEPKNMAPILATYAALFLDSWSEHQPPDTFRTAQDPESGEQFMVAIVQPLQLIQLVEATLYHAPVLLTKVLHNIMTGVDPRYQGHLLGEDENGHLIPDSKDTPDEGNHDHG